MDHWFTIYDDLAWPGQQPALLRHKFLSWQTSLLCVVVDLSGGVSRINGLNGPVLIVFDVIADVAQLCKSPCWKDCLMLIYIYFFFGWWYIHKNILNAIIYIYFFLNNAIQKRQMKNSKYVLVVWHLDTCLAKSLTIDHVFIILAQTSGGPNVFLSFNTI